MSHSSTCPYELIVFDADGEEVPHDDGTLASVELLATITTDPAPTDLHVMVHGWNTDLGDAVGQYDRWVEAMLAAEPASSEAGRRTVFLGIHWPSKAWADDEAGVAADRAVLESYAVNIADTTAAAARARAALGVLWAESRREPVSGELSPDEVAAIRELESLEPTNRPFDEISGPGSDEWDAVAVYERLRTGEPMIEPFGTDVAGLLDEPVLTVARLFTFRSMKRRARVLGERGLAELLAVVQKTSPRLRLHLMGHSFGCVAVSAALSGNDVDRRVPSPVDSLLLVQGAMSLWAYAADIPEIGGPGDYASVVTGRRVTGPIVTTRSTHDYVVGVFYPLAAALLGQVRSAQRDGYDDVRYGGTGEHGLRGVDGSVDIGTGVEAAVHAFEPGRVHNIDASDVICRIVPVIGAHNDVYSEQVSAIAWQAMRGIDALSSNT